MENALYFPSTEHTFNMEEIILVRVKNPSYWNNNHQARHRIQHNVIAESIRTGGLGHLSQFTEEVGSFRVCVEWEMQHHQTLEEGDDDTGNPRD